ncbi:FecR protein [Marinobacter persicus]|uniref:FecR protein n=1 Tax=Marinobacter persicus TaxID=930118 RepID=A0A1I3P4P2_9GAMM|nr:FecR domain-containing protein [Marinobacter persicus]GHD51075.1 hypothetical protein GCM10008110_22500 [Marinobacter persicus]SFJ16016.1 FecR protein [Marinobacter persicus]
MPDIRKHRARPAILAILLVLPALAAAELSITRGSALTANVDADYRQTANSALSWSDRKPQPARASSVSGNVSHISGVTGSRRPLTEGAMIRVGDELLSGSGSAAIQLADGTELRLSPDSRLMFNRLDRQASSKATDTRLRLHRGELHSRVTPVKENGGRFEIETPSSIAAVKGTVFALQADNNGSRIQVTEGSVDFGRPGNTRAVPAGYGASLSTDNGDSVRVRQLPPAPTLDTLPAVVDRLPLEISWQSLWPSRYRLDIFDEDTGTWLHSREVSGTGHTVSDLDNGRYEIQLAALNQQEIAGMPDTATLEVNVQAAQPKLIAPADGDTVNEDKPTFRWQLTGNNETARVEIAETTAFENLIATSNWADANEASPTSSLGPGQYYWRVASRAGGSSEALSESRKLVINGSLPPVRIISVNYLDKQVRIYWEEVDTATDYRLQLAEEPEFRNIIKEADVDDTTAALRLIPGRRYFVRVKAISDGPLASRWGPGRELYLE